MNALHTPGPWSRNKYGALVDSSANVVNLRSVSILCSGSDVAEAEANTDLIAAAPELLEAAQMALGIMNLMAWDDDPTALRLKEAIAKATGAA